MNEHEVVAEVEREVRRHGVRDTLILISPGPYLREPSDRVFEREDLTLFSLELAGPSGYWVELGGVCAFTEPGSADARLYACCLDTFERGRQLLRTGARAADVAAALRQTLQAWGYEAGIWGGHGIGLDVGEVPQLVQTDDSTLEAGMTFGFHPHIIDPASGHAAYIADTLLVSESGGVGLSRTARTLHILPSKESSR